MSLPFVKMHGAGNDFVVFDVRADMVRFTPEQLEAIAHRRTGVGCDQVIIIEPSKKADVFMRIYNADGTQVDACGNATRCVAWLVMEESKQDDVIIETNAGMLSCSRAGNKKVRVNMGEPKFGWQEIPLSEERDTLHLDITERGLSDGLAVSMGNPHLVFTVDDVEDAPVHDLGPRLEHHELFPKRTNVSFAQVIDDTHVKLRVWERGAGETLACGTAACATLVGLTQRGLLSGKAAIKLPGGVLEIEWDQKANRVFKTGPVAASFIGVLDVG
jgi:diaminopimelate epimerase